MSTNSGFHLKNRPIVHEFWGEDQKKGLRPKIYAMFHEIRCESTQKLLKKQFLLINSRAVKALLLRVSGLDLHSSSPEPINFFGSQSSLEGAQRSFGGAQAIFWGALPRNAPRGAGPGTVFQKNGYKIKFKTEKPMLWLSFRKYASCS